MCYAIPAKIIELHQDTAKVDYGGVIKTVNICLLESLKIGDYILIHAGFAIEKVEKKSAEETLDMIREMMKLSEKGKTDSSSFRGTVNNG
jgi:hydrogenase expression/formation protein HypC